MGAKREEIISAHARNATPRGLPASEDALRCLVLIGLIVGFAFASEEQRSAARISPMCCFSQRSPGFPPAVRRWWSRSEQFRDAPRDRETRGQAWRFYAKQVDQPSDPVFVLGLDQEIGR
jgi:hypothetical protein